MKNQRKAYSYALLAVLCWSTIGSAFKISLKHIGISHLLLISSLTACLVLFLVVLIRKNGGLLRKVTLREAGSSAVMGLLNPFLYYLVLLKAYDLLPAQEAGTLNYIWPVVLVLLSIPLLKQKIRLTSILAILVSFAGILIISTHGHILEFRFTDPLGVMLALGSAVFWALYWILNMQDKREDITRLFLNFCFGFSYVFIYILIFQRFSFPSWKGLAGGIYLGLFEMGIPFILWLKALNYSSTTARVSNLIYLSPFLSLIIIHFVVGEKILLSTLTGLVLIVSGILWQGWRKS